MSEVGPRRPHLVGVPRRLVLAAVALVVVGPQTARPLPLFARAASRYSPGGADLRSPRPAARGRARRAPALLTGGRRRGALGARAVVGDAERYHHRRGPRPGRGPGQHRTGRVGVHRRGGPPGRTRPARTRRLVPGAGQPRRLPRHGRRCRAGGGRPNATRENAAVRELDRARYRDGAERAGAGLRVASPCRAPCLPGMAEHSQARPAPWSAAEVSCAPATASSTVTTKRRPSLNSSAIPGPLRRTTPDVFARGIQR